MTPAPVCAVCGAPKVKSTASAGPRWRCPTCEETVEERIMRVAAAAKERQPTVGYLSAHMTRKERIAQQRERHVHTS